MIPIIRPTLPPYEELEPAIREILATGMITSGKFVREFEQASAAYLGVRHAIALSSCTTGLMLAMSELPPHSEVILPGFTFSGTYQGAQWNDLEPVVVDVDESCNIDPEAVERAITPRTSAIVGVHVSGVPCQVDRLEALARKHNLKLFFDAAHALGSVFRGRKIGNFGDAEIFSLGATKVLAVGEGGLMTTNDDEFARRMRLAVNHGHGPDDLDCVNKAQNGRLEEFNGLVGVAGLRHLDAWIDRRNEIARRYRERLSKLRGITFPRIPEQVRWTVKDFSIFIEAEPFGVARDDVFRRLREQEIQTKRYYWPPLHRLAVFGERFQGLRLPRTEWQADRVLSLPAYSHMPWEHLDQVCEALERMHGKARG